MAIEDWKENPATDKQRGLLFSLFKDLGIDKDEWEKETGRDISEMTKGDMSAVIDNLTAQKKGEEPKPKEEQKQEKKEPKNVPARKQESFATKGSEMALARASGIPEDMADMFFMKLHGNPYIKVAGLQYLAGKIGHGRIHIESHYDEEHKQWIAEAKIYPKLDIETIKAVAQLNPELQRDIIEELMQPTNGLGSASKESVEMSTMHPFLREMAETRALGRALRSYTNYGGTSYEEMPTAEIERD